jgi:hypothetical protein
MPPTPATPRAISKPRLLIGEGDDEVFFFEALLARLNLDDIQVEKYGGKDNLSRYLRELRLRPGNERIVALGVTRDADTDCGDAFTRICGALGASGFALPAAPGQIATGPLSVGVFVMPDNLRPGMLEDLCMDSVTADPAFRCVDEYFRCVAAASHRQPGNMAKARVHAWLSSQAEPDRRLGEAAHQGYWPWDASAFEPIKRFVQLL